VAKRKNRATATLGDIMQNIMDMVMQAFSGKDALEGIIIAVICALLTGRLALVIIWAVIALAVDTFLPVVYSIVQTGNTEGAATAASQAVTDAQANWTLVAVKYVVYLVVIGILYVVKSALFRRG
jgi:hypothetical protein